MNKTLTLLIVSLFLSGSPQKVELPQVDSHLKEELKNYLKTHYMTPEDYIISKFKHHDVVFLGEFHRIKHDVELVQALIPRLYENGVYILGTEFARREDQPLIDRLINSPDYDESLARQIQFNLLISWGYQEYADIYKAAWRLNRRLPEGSRKFHILGLGDSPDWTFIKTEADRNNPAIMRKVWPGGGSDVVGAQVILDEAVAKGEKALIYCGIHHAFTQYKQPIFDEQKQSFIRFEETRMGNFVYREIGKQAITIYLHAAWPSAQGYSRPYVYPVDGLIDAVMADMEPSYRRVGFDTRSTPFAPLSGETSIYKHGYEKFRLEMYCDGYIYQKSLSEYVGVTPIKDFVNEKNIDQARLQSPNLRYRTASIEDFNRAIASDADIPRWLAHLH